MNWSALISVVVGILLVFLAVQLIQKNPGLFTKEKLGSSIFTFGVLTLIIIAVIAICVWILK